MSHFYGTVDGKRQKSEATRRGFKDSGLTTFAAGWSGAVRVDIRHDSETGKDIFEVSLVPWRNSGGRERVIATGELDSDGGAINPAFSAGFPGEMASA
jgi:hypothetical protein